MALSRPGVERVAEKYLEQSHLLEDGPTPVFGLSLRKEPPGNGGSASSFVKYHLGQDNFHATNKVVLMVGATDSRRTAIINRMINHILGVKWEDPFRFKLIHGTADRSQAESQTAGVRAYVVNHQKGFQIPFSLTITDTSGFETIRRVEQGQLLAKQIREFFSTPGCVDHIDAVCYVDRGPSPCGTYAQKDAFDSILAIWGKDRKDCIKLPITSADGPTPPWEKALKKADNAINRMPIVFSFNNSARFVNSGLEDEGSFNVDETLWQDFFALLKVLPTKSLTLTRDILRDRKALESEVEALQTQIQIGLVQLEELRKTKEALKRHRADMQRGKDFSFKGEIVVPVKTDSPHHFATNCENCLYTCHYPCYAPYSYGFYGCSSIKLFSQECAVCPGRCPHHAHSSGKYRFEYEIQKVSKTYQELKQKYESASGEVMTPEKMTAWLDQDYDEVRETLMDLIQEAACSIHCLQEIALAPNPLSISDYINILIESEEEDAKLGSQDRIRSLRTMRTEVERRRMFASGATLPSGRQYLYLCKRCKKRKKHLNYLKDRKRLFTAAWPLSQGGRQLTMELWAV